MPAASILILASVLMLLQLADAQSTCAVGRISLLPLPTTTFTVGNLVYTFGFCYSVNSPLSNLAQCATTGFAQAHNRVNLGCVASYDTIFTGLTALTTNNGAFFVVQDSTGQQRANVSVICDRSATAGQVSLLGSIPTPTTTGGVTTTLITLSSLAGCNIDAFFCSDTVACADSTKSCIQGICFDPTCPQLSLVRARSKSPANFIGEYSLSDCHGTPLGSLPNSSFTVTMNGISVNSVNLQGEVSAVIGPAATSPVPLLTTLLLDQSQSVLTNGQSALKQAALSFLNVVSTNINHYVALVAFDGGSTPVTVVPHTNNFATLQAAVNSQLPPSGMTDPGSTDLYTAVMSALDEAYRVSFSFGNTSVSVVASVVVFSDGYDTAGRRTANEAILKAQAMANKVRILAVGTVNTSDTSFLSAIATSGFYQFISLSNLVQTFTDAAAKLVALTTNNYQVLLCVPMRSSFIPISVSLTGTQFPISTGVTVSVNASNFTGGCTRSMLLADVTQASTVATQSLTQLTVASPINAVIPSGGAFYFWFQLPVAQTIVVTPNFPAFFVRNQRCILSQYCSDGTFTTFLTAVANTRYDVVVRPPLDQPASSIMIYSMSGTISPALTLIPGVITSPTFAPVNLSALSDNAGPGDVDEPAAFVFFGIGMVFFVGFFIAAFYVRSTQMKSLAKAAKKRRELPQSRELEKGLLAGPVFTDVQPYRQAVTPLSNRVSFYDRSASIQRTPRSQPQDLSHYVPPETIDYDQSARFDTPRDLPNLTYHNTYDFM